MHDLVHWTMCPICCGDKLDLWTTVCHKFESTYPVNIMGLRPTSILDAVHVNLIADRLSLLLSATVGVLTPAAWARCLPSFIDFTCMPTRSSHLTSCRSHRHSNYCQDCLSCYPLIGMASLLIQEWCCCHQRWFRYAGLFEGKKRLAGNHFRDCTDALTTVRTLNRKIQHQALAALTRAGAF